MPQNHLMTRTSERPTLAEVFSELVDHLSEIRKGKNLEERADSKLALWGSDDYLYLEANLSLNICLEADLSIHQGKVFIRMEV